MTARRSKHWCMPPVCSGCLSAWQTAGCMLWMQRSRRMRLREVQKNFRGLSCGLREMAYAVYPETLLFDSEALSLPVLEAGADQSVVAAQSGTGLEDLFGAFGYMAYTDFTTSRTELSACSSMIRARCG